MQIFHLQNQVIVIALFSKMKQQFPLEDNQVGEDNVEEEHAARRDADNSATR